MIRGNRHTSVRFTLEPTKAQVDALHRHVGAARFAFNECLREVVMKLDAKRNDPSVKVPWSGFDLITHFNDWKVTSAAGVDNEGNAGLPWRREVSQQVFEEAAVDLGRALTGFSDGRSGKREGRRPRFPHFKKKASSRASFRMRNRNGQIRVGGADARAIRLPTIGSVSVRECTRKLRRMVRTARAKILFATVTLRSDGRWHVTLNLEAAAFHASMREPKTSESVGIDRGLRTFAVVAADDGREVARIESPRPLHAQLRRLRRRNKSLARKPLGSRNRQRARVCVAKIHAHIASVRRDFVHRASTQLAKTHGRLVLETLCTSGLMQSTLARALADSAWALFATMLTYKARWYDAELVMAARFFPSTRTCSACGVIGERLLPSNRTFRCGSCGHSSDRDTNAAVNLARYVAAKHAETRNAYGGSRSDELTQARETTAGEVGKALPDAREGRW